ncbi:MAG: transposase family protein [Clostridia bacterium]|nr:transposase family protein [Clostridia bacterium]
MSARKRKLEPQPQEVRKEKREKKASLPNCVNTKGSIPEQIEDNQETIEKTAAVFRQMLPSLLNKLSQIKDPRSPHKVTHKITTLLIYGIIMFVFQIGSRRKTNREMTDIGFENLKAIFPELETLPHADTLARLLEKIDVIEIQASMIELLKDLIRRKKFRKYLHNKRLLIAIDGTQKFYRDYQWDYENPGMVRHVGKEKKEQHYVYVLESVVIFDNGITLPFFSIFLNGSDITADAEVASVEENSIVGEVVKQDCERKAFRRMADIIKSNFRNTSISIVVDGLYACGPIIQICQKNKWGYMITLKSGAMSVVWDDAIGIMKLEERNRQRVMWGDRTQDYQWANEIEYEYRDNKNILRQLKLNVVICYESWIEVHKRSTGETEECSTRYAWLSSTPLKRSNVFRRCTMARYRWKIENNILTEKHQGYNYEHCYSYTWEVMEGYHYLMKIARFINVMVANSEWLDDKIKKLGIQVFFQQIWRIVCYAVYLNHERILSVANSVHQWRLNPAS